MIVARPAGKDVVPVVRLEVKVVRSWNGWGVAPSNGFPAGSSVVMKACWSWSTRQCRRCGFTFFGGQTNNFNSTTWKARYERNLERIRLAPTAGLQAVNPTLLGHHSNSVLGGVWTDCATGRLFPQGRGYALSPRFASITESACEPEFVAMSIDSMAKKRLE
jgi:hypothetical protein